MKNMCAKVYETLKNISEGLFSPKTMAEFYLRQHKGIKEIIRLCKKHYLHLLVPELSILSGICWIGWKVSLFLVRVEAWPASLFQNKKGMTWE